MVKAGKEERQEKAGRGITERQNDSMVIDLPACFVSKGVALGYHPLSNGFPIDAFQSTSVDDGQ